MSLKRTNSMLAAGVLALLLGASALGQGLREMDLFAPAEINPYGGGPKPKQGYFFVFDGLNWYIRQPDRTPIGFPGSRLVFFDPFTSAVQTNDMDTGPLAAEDTEGTRIEFGRVRGRHGWLLSTFHLNDQAQQFSNVDVDMVFQDVPDAFGFPHLEGEVGLMEGYLDDAALYTFITVVDLPITFDEVSVDNRAETWGVELMYLCRLCQTHRDGFVELFAGVRYLEFDETFTVEARGIERLNADGDPVDGISNFRFDFDTGPDADPTATDWSPVAPGVVLADSHWLTEAENHIIGPQLGGRWFTKRGRWTLSAEGRFFAGWNLQNIRNHGVLGSHLDDPQPWNWEVEETEVGDPPVTITTGGGMPLYVPFHRNPYKFDHTEFIDEWSPAGELRVELLFQLTRAVSLKAGWTGLWVGGIARASAMPDYTISDQSVMGINRGNNDQTLFINGLNVGVTVNR